VPIPVTCQCGQSFAAGDHLAGRTVQCPKCKSPLHIPAPQAAATPSPFSSPAPPSPFGGGPAGPSIFDDAGMRTFTPGRALCPACNEELQPNAVLCVKCGYNLQLGRKMRSFVTTATATHDGHGAAAASLLAKAAKQIDEDKEEEKKKLKEGMPWWMLGAIFLFCLGTCIMLLYLPADLAIGYAQLAVAFAYSATQLYNVIRLIIIAFRDRPLHGILLIVNPGYSLIYMMARWDETSHVFWSMLRAWFFAFMVNIFLGIAMAIAQATKPRDGMEMPEVDRPAVTFFQTAAQA